MLRIFVQRLTTLGRLKKRSILILYDLFAMILGLWAAFSTRLGIIYVPYSRSVILSAGVSFVVGLAALYRLRIYHIVLRYFDLRTVTRLFAGSALAALAWVTLVYLVNAHITVGRITFLVPRSVAQMLHSGEKSGKLGFVMEQVSGYAEQELKEKIAELTRYIEPAMIVVMGAIIGGVALALMLPIFTISKVVAH